MPEGPDGKTIIIVKKVSGHAGHHGGAWKVAYADFVTAMMALFMVLWLVNSAAEPTRQRIASYFRKPGVFQKGSGTPLELGGAGILPDAFAPPADANSQLIVDKKVYEVNAETGTVREYFDPTDGAKGDAGKEHVQAAGDQPQSKNAAKSAAEIAQEKADVEELVKQLEEAIRSEHEAGLLGKVDVKIDQRGLLIEIMDTESTSMFQVGSANIIGEAEEQLLKIAGILAKLPNPVDIEGHTDGRPYRGALAARYDNWNLASDRAHSARRILEKAGMQKEQIARVVGYADQRLKVPGDALDPSNRRITIAMRFTEQASDALRGTKTVQTRPRPLTLKSDAPAEAPPAAQPANPSPQAVPGAAAPAAAASAAETPAAQPSAAPEQAPAAAAGIETSAPGQLAVEVQTTLPEGRIVIEEGVEQEGPRPAGETKDKIFGPKNPFFN